MFCSRSCVVRSALVAVLLAASSAPVLAGAWTMGVGKGQVIVSGLYAEALESFDGEGDPAAIPVFRKAEVQAHLEYGIADGWTAIGRTELKTAATLDHLSFDAARFGLSGLGARVRLWQDGASVVSVETTARLATGSASRSEDGDVDLRLLGGHGFEVGRWTGFVDVQAAYRLRFGDVDDEVRADVTLGLRPKSRLLLLAQSFNAFTVKAGNEGARREHKLQLSAVYDLGDALSLQIGGIATVAGQRSLGERGVVTALWYRF